MEALEPMRADVGDVFGLRLFALWGVVLTGATLAREALGRARLHLRSRIETDPVARLLRHGMLVTDGEAHDRARALVEPFFRPAYLEPRAPRMLQQADARIEAWPDGGVVEMMEEMHRLALEILLDVLFDLPAEEAASLWEPLRAARAYIAPGLWLFCPRLFPARPPRLLRSLDERVRERIRERQARPEGVDLLSHWARTPGMGEEEIRDQMMTLLIAGHDTVGTWLAWTIALLALHPEVQARARQEVLQAIGDRPPEPGSVARLSFLRAVAMESMRLFPPIPVLNRYAPSAFSMAGVRIPAGARVMISIYTLHRHPGLWKDPRAFKPERFLGWDSRGGPFRYLPFGGGPRFCVGAPMARLEGLLVLARMLQRVEWEPAFTRLRPRLRATLDPWPGVPIRIRRRRKEGCPA